jgi:hypothetical protein
MTDYGSMGTPVAMATAISLDPGIVSDQKPIYAVPSGQLFIIEYIGIGASLQPHQELCAAVLPVFDGGLTVYPIVTPGKSNSHNPQMPLRRFGSQQVLLYADQRVEISAFRSDAADEAHIEFNLSGRLVTPGTALQTPGNVRVVP